MTDLATGTGFDHPANRMNSPSGTLGKYEIIREIARSNDIVYEAYDPVVKRRVALKELNLPPGLPESQRQDRIQRFHREARAAGSLVHPHIVTIYEVGIDGDRHFIAMEYLDGRDLRKELESRGVLPVEEAIDIAVAVLDALACAHRAGVIHRDIKPENIQILSSGTVKLTDFGIARLSTEPNLTVAGQIFGTPSYMSPEQVADKDLDARSDLFSVGVVLYEMVSGQKPYPGDSVVTISHKIVNADPDPLPHLDPNLQRVLAKALEKSPALRYQSAEEMKRDLLLVKRFVGSSQAIVNPLFATPTPTPAPPYPPGVPPSYPPGPSAPISNPTLGGPPIAPPVLVTPPGGSAPGWPPAPGPPTSYPTMTGLPPVPVNLPPPRKPLVSPETQAFFAKLLTAIVVIGLVIGIVIALILAFSGSEGRTPWSGNDSSNASRNPGSDSRSESARESSRPGFPWDWGRRDPPARTSEAARLVEEGRRHLESGDPFEAQSLARQAVEHDPDYPDGYALVATTYEALALLNEGSLVECSYWLEAAEHCELAYERATSSRRHADPVKANAFRDETIIYYVRAAMTLNLHDAPADARRALYAARRLAPRGSKTERDIDRLLMLLGG